MSTLKRQTIVRLKNGKKKVTYVKLDVPDDGPEYTVAMSHDSRHWQVRLDERDAFGPVTVYDAQGQVVRTISKDDLRRPWQARVGNSWNNCLFAKRISDKV